MELPSETQGPRDPRTTGLLSFSPRICPGVEFTPTFGSHAFSPKDSLPVLSTGFSNLEHRFGDSARTKSTMIDDILKRDAPTWSLQDGPWVSAGCLDRFAWEGFDDKSFVVEFYTKQCSVQNFRPLKYAPEVCE